MKLLFIVLIIMLSGCSSIKVSHDYEQTTNFDNIQTFQWSENKHNKVNDDVFHSSSSLIANRIKTAIENELLKQNMTLINNQADVYINFYMHSTQETAQRSGTSIGIGLGSVFNQGFGSVGFNMSPDRKNIQKAHLIIEVLDQQKQLIWRGNSSSPIDSHPEPQEITKLINEMVQKVLEHYPPQ